ncbi:MAG: hypothetical protein P1U61_09190 [Legionellaceae bacterium]|nr:hypothetical protein [Legionellaceae bacterium]
MPDTLDDVEKRLTLAWENYACESIRQWVEIKYPTQTKLNLEQKKVLQQQIEQHFYEQYHHQITESNWHEIKSVIVDSVSKPYWAETGAKNKKMKGKSLSVLQEEIKTLEAELLRLKPKLEQLTPALSKKQQEHLGMLIEKLQVLKASEPLAGEGVLHVMMRGLVGRLEVYADAFLQHKLQYQVFKALVEACLDDKNIEILKRPNAGLHHLYNAVVFVFRSIFRLFDLGWTVGQKTMAETHTPFAQSLVGRKHFFEYAENSVSQQLMHLAKELEHSLQALDHLIPVHNELELTHEHSLID